MVDLSTLSPGDIVRLKGDRGEREVVRVIDTTGAFGGIVDCKRIGGRRSRSAGFEFGNAIETVVSKAPR